MAPPVASYIGWWDASVASSITGGSAVSQWSDLSANAYHLTQATAGAKPSWGTRTLNGLPVVDFDGGDWLDRATTPALDTTMTLCAVVVPDAVTTGAVLFCGVGAAFPWLLYIDAADSKFKSYSGAFLACGTAETNGVASQITTKWNGASSQIYKNGTGGTTGTASLTATGLTFGADESHVTSPFNGAIAEAVLYDTALNDSDRGSVEAYLKAKWITPGFPHMLPMPRQAVPRAVSF